MAFFGLLGLGAALDLSEPQAFKIFGLLSIPFLSYILQKIVPHLSF